MTAEEALATIEHALDRGYLNQVEEIVFRAVWEGRSYLQTAHASGYDYGYIKDTAYKLWRSLSDVYGEKVTKHNVKGIVQRSRKISLRQSQVEPQQAITFYPPQLILRMRRFRGAKLLMCQSSTIAIKN